MGTRRSGIAAAAALGSTLFIAPMLGCGMESTTDVAAPEAATAELNGDGNRPAASGHANWINPAPPGNPFAGDEIHRSFHARTFEDGVRGKVVQHNKVSGFWFKGDIDCLRLLGTTEAVLSGPVRESSNPAIVGSRVIFRVGDGGEGANADPDRTSGLNVQAPGSAIDCTRFVNPLFVPIESGNLQVEP